MTPPSNLRVLSVLLRPSPTIVLANFALAGWAGYLAVTAPDDLRGPYVVLLLCQSFAASTGYATRARRGHFDQILAGRSTRVQFALAHAGLSILFGATTWLTVSLFESVGSGGHWPLGLTVKALAAFAYISAMAWAVSVPFSRYAAGVVWLVGAIVLAGSGRLVSLRNTYAAAADTWMGAWQAAVSAFVFPPLMVGEPSSPPFVTLAVVIAASIVAVAAGVAFIACVGLPLEDAQ
jgi:hypothetical protein